ATGRGSRFRRAKLWVDGRRLRLPGDWRHSGGRVGHLVGLAGNAAGELPRPRGDRAGHRQYRRAPHAAERGKPLSSPRQSWEDERARRQACCLAVAVLLIVPLALFGCRRPANDEDDEEDPPTVSIEGNAPRKEPGRIPALKSAVEKNPNS